MALTLTDRASLESQRPQVRPQLVLEIEGVDTLFGAIEIQRAIRIGDPGLVIGDDWVVGGLTPYENQLDVISIDSVSGNKIDQQLRPDQGSVSSVSSIQITLIDRGLALTEVATPGLVIPDVLGAKAILWLGFKDTAFKEDFVKVFSGIIDDCEIEPGTVRFNIASPEQLKRQEIFQATEIQLNEALDAVETTITLIDASKLKLPVLGPDATYDSAIKFYIRVDDEIIRYTGISGNDLTGCTRGALGSDATTHDDQTKGKQVFSLEDDAVVLALKIMLSGVNDNYIEDVSISAFEEVSPSLTVPNALFFDAVDVMETYGITVGDYVTTTLSGIGGNNVTSKIVTDAVKTDNGSYIVLGGVTFTVEPGTVAVMAVRSKYDTLGVGLAMTPDQVDVTEHEFWDQFQLSGFQYRFVIQEGINGKEFLDKQVYFPVGAFSIPRQGKASMGFHVGPVIRGELKILNKDNIKSPEKIKLRRTTNKNFYNTIIYEYDNDPIKDKFFSALIVEDEDSRNQIKVGIKPLKVESLGLREDINGQNIALRTAQKYLVRYKFAAQFIENIQVLFRDGFALEAGDIFLFDPEGLQVANLIDGDRDKPAKIWQIINKKLDLKTGNVELSIIDPDLDFTERYGGISPSSEIVSATTTTLLIQDSFGSVFPGNESRKWENFSGKPIRVHSPDFSFDEEVTLLGVDEVNDYQLNIDPSTPFSMAPSAGYVVEIGSFNSSTDSDPIYKASYVYFGPTVTIVSGIDNFSFTVGGGDVGYFTIGSLVRVSDPTDFSDDSPEVEVLSVVGTTVTVDATLGFTPSSGYIAWGMDMPDATRTYRYF